jgi:manganese transport protein
MPGAFPGREGVMVELVRAWRGEAGFDAAAALGAIRPPAPRRSASGGALASLMLPATVASVAYMDPGNVATNIESGASFGYKLLWVVVLANLVAMLFQALSARLGIATGLNLAEVSRARLPRPVVAAMWVLSEIAAMATDLAELLGAGIGIELLFHLPLLASTLIAGAATYATLLLQRWGLRLVEAVVAALVGVVCAGYLVETVFAAPDWRAIGYHAVVPWLGGPDSMLMAAGIVGATVMPHALYLHSSLTQGETGATPAAAARLARASDRSVFIALGIAGLVNLAMMYLAAAAFHASGQGEVADIESAYRLLGPVLGKAAAAVFLVSLLASGASSSVVGTLAGQVIMQGFVGWRIPLWVRRLVTMAPSLIVVALGVDATRMLVLSQAVLSLVLPVPMLALIGFTARRSIMGRLANRPLVSLLALAAAAVILALNAMLLLDTLGLAPAAW